MITVYGFIGNLEQHLSDSSALAFAGVGDSGLVQNICSNGFAMLSKTDDGYFGRGVYLTFQSAYAAVYGGGCIPLELQAHG